MVYRDDVGALEARLTTLESELAAKTRQRDEAARNLIEAKARAQSDALAADWAAGGPQRRRKRRVALIVSSLMALTAAIGLFVKYRARGDREQAQLQRVIAQFEHFTDEMCTCTDTACAQAVNQRMTTWATEMSKEDPRPARDIDKATMEHMTQIGMRMGECTQKAMTPPNAID